MPLYSWDRAAGDHPRVTFRQLEIQGLNCCLYIVCVKVRPAGVRDKARAWSGLGLAANPFDRGCRVDDEPSQTS
jgi:hypothetical protein